MDLGKEREGVPRSGFPILESPSIKKQKKNGIKFLFLFLAVAGILVASWFLFFNEGNSGIAKETDISTEVVDGNNSLQNVEEEISEGRDVIRKTNLGNPRISVVNGSGDEVIGMDHNGTIEAVNLNITENLNVTGTGFFGYLGSVLKSITKGWFTDLVSTNVNATGDVNVSNNVQATYFLGNGSHLTDISFTEHDPLWSGNSTLVPYLASANVFTANQKITGGLNVTRELYGNWSVMSGPSLPTIKSILTSTDSYAGFGAMNSLVEDVGLSFISYGSSYPGTTFGLNKANLSRIYSYGSPLAIGTWQEYNFTLGSNDTKAITIDTNQDVHFGTNKISSVSNVTFSTDTSNHKIYDNDTCIIIEGDTATLNIC